MVSTPEFERGVVVGFTLACSIIQSGHDQPTMIQDALEAAGLDRKQMKAAGVEAYDLKILAPILRNMERRARGVSKAVRRAAR